MPPDRVRDAASGFLAGAVAEPLATALMVAGTEASPCRRVPRTGKDAHICAEFSQQGPRRDEVDARYGGQSGERGQVHSRRNFRIEPLYFALVEAEVIHEFAQHRPMTILDAAAPSQPQFRPIAA